jgi:hypothetical protein
MQKETEMRAKTEMQVKTEPGVPAEAVAAAEPAPTTLVDEPDSQLPAADAPALATIEAKKGVGVPAKSVASTASSATRDELLLDFVLAHQLLYAVPEGPSEGSRGRLMDGARALYRSLEPRDAFESILARLAVGVTNSTMDCLGQAAMCNQASPARGLNLRYGMKGAGVAVDLIKALDSHRGRGRQQVTVGNVNVESGGRAIVGNVESGEQRKQPTNPAPIRRSPTTKSDG